MYWGRRKESQARTVYDHRSVVCRRSRTVTVVAVRSQSMREHRSDSFHDDRGQGADRVVVVLLVDSAQDHEQEW